MPERRRSPHERALAYARRHGMFSEGARVLVGVSGGASLGLLGFLLSAQRALGLAEVAVASIERGDEATDAAEAVADVGRVARQLGLSFYAVRPEQAGVKGRARGLVRRELVALARAHGFDRVALGHTRDDDALRVLTELVRGRGLARLAGLAPRLSGGVVRPILGLSEAEAFSLARGLPALCQPLPGEGSEGRARPTLGAVLRASVLPRLGAVCPHSDVALSKLGRDARAARRALRREARARVASGRREDGALELAAVEGGRALALAVAEAALEALGLARTERARLAPRLSGALLRAGRGERELGPLLLAGVLVMQVPARRAVLVRTPEARRASQRRLRG